jgi:hypothetical protein
VEVQGIPEQEQTMSVYGAVPEELDNLGATLKRQMEPIDAVLAQVSAVLGGTTWTGPARERFESDWNGSFRDALQRLTQAFEAAGQDCLARSQELRRVMGA